MNKLLLLTLLPLAGFSQTNCEAFLFLGDTLKYEACKIGEKSRGYYQFDQRFHDIYDEARAVCPEWSGAYRAKSTAYLKSGDFLNWKILIDKAVDLDFKLHLGYRAWCRYQFFRDYEGAITDLETLLSKTNYNIGYATNGDCHLKIALAIWYSAVGRKNKSIQTFTDFMNEEDYSPGKFDYFQLGAVYYQVKDYANALLYFNKQSYYNELADNAYYKGQVFKKLGKTKEYQIEKEKALQLMEEGKRLFDVYTHHENQIFISDIINN